AVAALVRFWSLGQSLWYDEFVSTQVINRGSELLGNVARLEGNPPLYFIGLWGWAKLFGGGDTALHALSALLGTATVTAVYAASREITASRRVARIAAALTAVNPMLVWFSQEARAYAL